MSPKDQLRQRLTEAQARTRSASNERAAAGRALNEAREAFARSTDATPNGRAFKRGKEALSALEAADAKLEDAREVEVGILQMIGGTSDVPGAAQGSIPGDGFSRAARELDLSTGHTRVEVGAGELMREPLASVSISPGEGLHAPSVEAPFVPKAQDRRLIYPVFPRALLDQSDLAITEFRQTGARTVTGSVERDPVAITEKAQLALGVTLVTPSVRQFAAVVDGVPNKLFEAVESLEAFLQNELRYQLDLAIDAHVMSQIAAAAPPIGISGATLIEQARNAVRDMRAVGGNPTVLALNPADAATLDLQKTELGYIFATRDSGSASPLWGTTIIESPRIEAPMLIDPTLLGVVYAAAGTVLIDPFTEMSKNQVRMRVEMDGLFHVRDVAGVRMISA